MAFIQIAVLRAIRAVPETSRVADGVAFMPMATLLTRRLVPLTWRVSDGAVVPMPMFLPAAMAHPSSVMADAGCRLIVWEISHPESEQIERALAPFLKDLRVRLAKTATPMLRATILTPSGERQLF